MSFQILQQPDEKYAIFDTGTDTIIIWDATADEITQWFVEQAIERTRRDVRDTIERIEEGMIPRSAITWEKALAKDREHDGEASREIEFRRG